MNEFERKNAHKITVLLMQYKISGIFCEPIDLTRPDFADYAKVIKEPMDLLTILRKLDANRYSVDQWKYDVDLVFNNALLFYPKSNIIHILAEQMKIWFYTLLDKYPIYPTKWQEALEKASYSYMKLLINSKSCKANFPQRIAELINPTDEYQPPVIEDPPQRKQTRKVEPQTTEDSTPQPRKVAKDSTPATAQPLTDVQKIKLLKKIREITDEANLVAVLSLIQAKEPALGVTENSIVSLNQLQATTLRELRTLVRSF